MLMKLGPNVDAVDVAMFHELDGKSGAVLGGDGISVLLAKRLISSKSPWQEDPRCIEDPREALIVSFGSLLVGDD